MEKKMSEREVTHKICIVDSMKSEVDNKYTLNFKLDTTPKITEKALLDRIKHIAKSNGVAVTLKTAYAMASKYFGSYNTDNWIDFHKMCDSIATYDGIVELVNNNKELFTISKMNR